MKSKTLIHPFLLASVMAFLLAISTGTATAQETSRVIPFNNVATTLPPGGPQDVTVQVWDAAAAGNLIFSEAQPGLAVDASGNISFVLGSKTAGPPAGLDPNNFPPGSSRYVDVVDATNTSVLTSGRLPLNAVAFSISPGPKGDKGDQGVKGDKGDKGDIGPPGPVNSVLPGDGSIVIGGSVANPTVAVAPNGIGNANIADGSLSPGKINGSVATLGTNTFTGNQVINNGKLGIGTANPLLELDVRGRLILDPGSSPGLFTSSTAGEQNRYLTLLNSPFTPSASGLKAGGVLVADSYDFANPDKNTLIVKGKVGIGAAPSSSSLEIAAQDGLEIFGFQPFITLRDSSSPPPCLLCPRPAGFIQSVGGGLDFIPNSFQGHGVAMVITDGGNVGIGTANPTVAKVVVIDPNIGTGVYGESATGSGIFGRSTNANGWGVFGDNTAGGWAGFFNGKVRVGVLTIAGGADLAEKFEVSAPATASAETKNAIQPGMVVSIDPAHPGQLVLSTKAYDRRAAGVISGAGGVNPGMLMGQSGSVADGDQPVAMAGRVYCWADASRGAIEPGDLLTPSTTPGHAMKVTDLKKAQGAIIGKALTGLREGKGLVLILVTLR